MIQECKTMQTRKTNYIYLRIKINIIFMIGKLTFLITHTNKSWNLWQLNCHCHWMIHCPFPHPLRQLQHPRPWGQSAVLKTWPRVSPCPSMGCDPHHPFQEFWERLLWWLGNDKCSLWHKSDTRFNKKITYKSKEITTYLKLAVHFHKVITKLDPSKKCMHWWYAIKYGCPDISDMYSGPSYPTFN